MRVCVGRVHVRVCVWGVCTPAVPQRFRQWRQTKGHFSGPVITVSYFETHSHTYTPPKIYRYFWGKNSYKHVSNRGERRSLIPFLSCPVRPRRPTRAPSQTDVRPPASLHLDPETTQSFDATTSELRIALTPPSHGLTAKCLGHRPGGSTQACLVLLNGCVALHCKDAPSSHRPLLTLVFTRPMCHMPVTCAHVGSTLARTPGRDVLAGSAPRSHAHVAGPPRRAGSQKGRRQPGAWCRRLCGFRAGGGATLPGGDSRGPGL